jgi:hypothetical protein
MSFSAPAAGTDGDVSRDWTGRELLAQPVRLRGIRLGQPIDLLLDIVALRLIGFDVRCGDDVVRFLPLAAARMRPDEIEVRSALLLLDEGDTSFYRRRTRPLRELRGLSLAREGSSIGTLAEVVVAEDGEIAALVLEDGRRVVPDGSTTLTDQASAA